MNDKQRDGLASLLDNFGIVAISSGVVITFGFGEENMPQWLLFTLLIIGATAIGLAYFLRK